MVKVVLRAKEVDRTFEFKKMNTGTLAMLQLMVLLASIGEDAVIAIMDEANWQKMAGEKQK